MFSAIPGNSMAVNLVSRDVKLKFFPKSKLGSKKLSKNRNSNFVCPMFVKLVLTISDGQSEISVLDSIRITSDFYRLLVL